MKIKKNPKANLEHYSKVFTLLGLVLSLYVTYVFIEHKSYAAVKKVVVDVPTISDPFDSPVVVQLPNKPQQPKVQAPEKIVEPKDDVLLEDPRLIEKVLDTKDVKELSVEDTTDDESTEEELLDILEGEDLSEPEELGVETVPFTPTVTAPVFPGCEKYIGKKEKAKKCFNKKIAKFFGKNFDTGIAEEAGLTGVQKIYCRFIVNNRGEISPNIQVSRTENVVYEEIKEVIKKLPKMKPATQNGSPVNLIYDLPVKFLVK